MDWLSEFFWHDATQLDNKIGINNKIISFTKKVMTYWKTRMCLHAENKLIETEDIKIKCGKF